MVWWLFDFGGFLWLWLSTSPASPEARSRFAAFVAFVAFASNILSATSNTLYGFLHFFSRLLVAFDFGFRHPEHHQQHARVISSCLSSRSFSIGALICILSGAAALHP